LRDLVARWPGDAELLYELSAALNVLGAFEDQAATAERAVTLDPGFGLARAALAETQAYLGRFDDARATVAQCLERLPNATWCMWVREFIDSDEGRCSDASARARIAIDPSEWNSYLELYYALTAAGEATPGAEEAMRQVVSRIHDPYRAKRMQLNLTLRLDELRGDFSAAMAHAGELRAHVAASSDTSTRAGAAIVSAEIAVETGQPQLAASFGRDFLARRQVWQSPPIAHDYSLSDDTLPQLAAFAYHAGAMPAQDYARELDAWRGKWDALLKGNYRPYLWVYGYAGIVQTPDEAIAATSALARYSPIPPFIPNGYLPEAGVGRTLWLAGREDEGLAYLSRAAHACSAGVHPISWVRAHAWLAEALAKRGDVGGACRENDVVLARWGSARPRSETAEAARATARALGCRPSPDR
jgi:serine/threonine-protein kinase